MAQTFGKFALTKAKELKTVSDRIVSQMRASSQIAEQFSTLKNEKDVLAMLTKHKIKYQIARPLETVGCPIEQLIHKITGLPLHQIDVSAETLTICEHKSWLDDEGIILPKPIKNFIEKFDKDGYAPIKPVKPAEQKIKELKKKASPVKSKK